MPRIALPNKGRLADDTRELFTDAGLEVKYYRYYDNKANALDWNGLKEDIKVRIFGLK